MKKTILLAAFCALATTLAVPASADDDRRDRRDDRYERRHDRDHDRYNRYDRNQRHVLYRPRQVVNGRYCDDRRHYRGVHYHVAARDYYRYGYPRDAYRLHRGSGLGATLIVTFAFHP